MTDPRPQMIRDNIADESDLYDIPIVGSVAPTPIQGITASGWYVGDTISRSFIGPFATETEALEAINEDDPITPLNDEQAFVCHLNILN